MVGDIVPVTTQIFRFGKVFASIAFCVYCIRNTVTGKEYIGSAENFRSRLNLHYSQLGRGTHHSKHLQASYDKHGPEVFEVYIIEVVQDISLLLEREQYFITSRKTNDPEFGYNMTPTAGSTKGYSHTEDHKRNITGSGNPFFGRKHTPETIEKISGPNNAFYGRKHSLETLEKISNKVKGENNHWFGKHLPDEVKEKISNTKKGKSPTKTEKAKLGYTKGAKTRAALTDTEVLEIRDLAQRGHTRYELMEKYGVSYSTITRVINRSNVAYAE